MSRNAFAFGQREILPSVKNWPTLALRTMVLDVEQSSHHTETDWGQQVLRLPQKPFLQVVSSMVSVGQTALLRLPAEIGVMDGGGAHRLRQALVIALAGLAVGLFAGTANASCGDYVRIDDPHTAVRTPGRPEPLNHPAPIPICQGPACDRHAPLPTPPTGTLERVTGDQWATLTGEGASDPSPGAWWCAPDALRSDAHRPAPRQRPPRVTTD